MAEQTARSTSTPILVGDRLFVAAEPDQLLCFDRTSGKRLWAASVKYYEALPKAEKARKPEYASRGDPLVKALAAEVDRVKRIELRAQIQKTLQEIDEKQFSIPADDHFAAHFGIVGFTMPTPVSDGQHDYIWNGMGEAACFDLDGRRRWISRLDTDHIEY